MIEDLAACEHTPHARSSPYIGEHATMSKPHACRPAMRIATLRRILTKIDQNVHTSKPSGELEVVGIVDEAIAPVTLADFGRATSECAIAAKNRRPCA